MMELDHIVGELLKKLNDLGIADNTISAVPGRASDRERSGP
jgi:hypothetical protein